MSFEHIIKQCNFGLLRYPPQRYAQVTFVTCFLLFDFTISTFVTGFVSDKTIENCCYYYRLQSNLHFQYKALQGGTDILQVQILYLVSTIQKHKSSLYSQASIMPDNITIIPQQAIVPYQGRPTAAVEQIMRQTSLSLCTGTST